MNGISLHIGLNSFDPNHYGGSSGHLNGCELDAGKMEAIANSNGFKTNKLLTSNATRKNVIDEIVKSSKALTSGDLFLLTYSGHGSQTPDQNGNEPDFLDETWCLYDGQLIDDELYDLWSGFKSGVRVLVLSDSCHSGSVIRKIVEDIDDCKPIDRISRNLPDSIALAAYVNNKSFYDGLLAPLNHKTKATIQASIRLISGCQDNQLSYETAFGGDFTNAVVKVWNGGLFRGNYTSFHSRVLNMLPSYQSPNHLVIGTPNPAFDNSKPFEI